MVRVHSYEALGEVVYALYNRETDTFIVSVRIVSDGGIQSIVRNVHCGFSVSIGDVVYISNRDGNPNGVRHARPVNLRPTLSQSESLIDSSIVYSSQEAIDPGNLEGIFLELTRTHVRYASMFVDTGITINLRDTDVLTMNYNLNPITIRFPS